MASVDGDEKTDRVPLPVLSLLAASSLVILLVRGAGGFLTSFEIYSRPYRRRVTLEKSNHVDIKIRNLEKQVKLLKQQLMCSEQKANAALCTARGALQRCSSWPEEEFPKVGCERSPHPEDDDTPQENEFDSPLRIVTALNDQLIADEIGIDDYALTLSNFFHKR
mmetsp:Transcript_20007/g.33003  ORF Transcript_20007/g.33003 Transcript_20007/m.33003 type:complete len:165 (+) Transcript_20007:289-783(+)|eukprot:CAMPEP_0203760796 /NCGR_PEP_ID=MMETSP0098-20131031/14008_1 /ASSEMBLY_ACC=CAM_ASM_000208 /TAXON_ID=96639 /ORGANISM=" , Strain NY0313808BC1" /LENGTH=164 /DNA_ID=CAMNT_0050654501 /DNA_START=196 /DNA_END=690 /DNA_ORIENTATION=-